MNLRESPIFTTTLGKIFPFAVVFSLYVASYGASFPGGGFQAGVMLGSIMVVVELVMERRMYSDMVFQKIELSGIVVLFALAIAGFVFAGRPFGGLYQLRLEGLIWSNAVFPILSLAIFLEVSGSMVLIFRNFLFWDQAPKLNPIVLAKNNLSWRRIERCVTGIVLGLLLLAIMLIVYFLSPGQVSVRADKQAWLDLAQHVGINNVVTLVYLGPRVFDTMMEAMVVVLTVVGMKHLGKCT